MIHMNESTYHELRDEYSGICMSCFTIKHGDTEPDADNYECEACGKFRVVGIDNLIIEGRVIIDDTKRPYATLVRKIDGVKYSVAVNF